MLALWAKHSLQDTHFQCQVLSHGIWKSRVSIVVSWRSKLSWPVQEKKEYLVFCNTPTESVSVSKLSSHVKDLHIATAFEGAPAMYEWLLVTIGSSQTTKEIHSDETNETG